MSETTQMSKNIKIGDTTHEALSDFKDEYDHSSFDSAIRQMLRREGYDV